MIINDLDGYYIVFDTKNWNTELDTLLLKYIYYFLYFHYYLHIFHISQQNIEYIREGCSSIKK